MSIDNIGDIAPRVQYVAATSQVAFDYPFPIFADADLTVDVDGVTKTLTTDYTVTGAGADTGGTVTFGSAPGNGAIVTIYRETEIARSTDFQQNGPFSSTSHNDELDKITVILQELKAQIGRAVRFPFTAVTSNAQALMSPFANFKGKFLRVTSAGVLEGADVLDNTVAFSQETIGENLYPRTQNEIDASVVPTNYHYLEADWFRYGAVGDWSSASDTDGQVAVIATDNLAALQAVRDVLAEKGGGVIRCYGGGDHYLSNSLDLRGISNIYLQVEPGTTLRSTRYTSLGGLIVMGHTGPVGSGVENVGVFGGGTLRVFQPNHDTISTHQTNTAYSVGHYVLSTDANGNERAYYCKTAGTTGPSSPPDVLNGSDTDGTVEWQDADNDNVIGIAADGVLVEGMSIPQASGKFMTVQTPNWKNVWITRNRCGTTNDKGIEVKGNQSVTGQEASFGDGVNILYNVIEESAYEGIEVEQGSFSSERNKHARIVGNTVRSAGVIDTTAAGIRVNRCDNVEYRGNWVLDAGGNGVHIRLCKNVVGDIHSESAGIFGVHLQELDGFSFDYIYVKDSTDAAVRESDDNLGGFVGRLIIDTAADGWETSSRDGIAPVVASYSMTGIAGSEFVGALPTLLPNVSAAKLQAFVLTITNSGGTLQHQIVDDILNTGAGPTLADRITGATATLTNTPTGADGSTAFAAGGKVGSATENEFIFNHANAASALHGTNSAVVVDNETTTPLMAALVRRSIDVNGTTLSRWHLQFRQQSDGADFDLNTTNIGAGEKVSVQINMYLP